MEWILIETGPTSGQVSRELEVTLVDNNSIRSLSADVQGSSINPCDETYTGPNAFSEPEVKSLADYMAANKGYIKAFLSFHSYSQLILYPWSYTSSASPDEQLLHEIAEVTAAGIKSVHGTEYTPQASNALCKLAANN